MDAQSKERVIEILLVEDNAPEVILTKEALKEVGIAHRLHVAVDGEEALFFLKKTGKFANAITPDIVLLDLNLPKKSGREVLVEIKNSSELRRIPVIILTNSVADQDIKFAYANHANCFITKTNNFNEFVGKFKVLADFWFSTAKLPDNH